MNQKYAYSTAINKDFYIPYIILHKRIMDFQGCKYPLVVLVTDEVTENGIKELEEYGIIVKKNNNLIKLQHSYFSAHFSTLSLAEYDLVLTFEADIIFLENYDYLFDIINSIIPDNKKLILFPRRKDKCFFSPMSFFFFARPSNKEYEKIQFLANISLTEHQLVERYYYQNTLFNNLFKANNSIFTMNEVHFGRNHDNKCLLTHFQHLPLVYDLFFNKTSSIKLLYSFLKLFNYQFQLGTPFFERTNLNYLNNAYEKLKKMYNF